MLLLQMVWGKCPPFIGFWGGASAPPAPPVPPPMMLTHKHVRTHAHHFFTPCPDERWAESSCYTSPCIKIGLTWAFCHALLSVITSCYSGISVRSLLNTSTDCKQVPPGLLFFPLSLAFVVDGLASSAGVRTIGVSSVSVAH